MGRTAAATLVCLLLAALTAGSVRAQLVRGALDLSDLERAFAGGQVIDLAVSKASSVVTLRDVVKIPPPEEKVLVKTFDKESLPEVLKPAFSKPGIMGVTVARRYVAIIRTPLHKEYQDVLNHELVHAYISLASPQPLPFWFQEGSAVHFSSDKGRKFYGQAAKPGVVVGRVVELPDTYKQKLQSFHYLIEKVGKKRFYEWYRNAVITGEVDARPLLGLKKAIESGPVRARRPFPIWLAVAIGLVVVVILLVGYYSTRREGLLR